MPLVALSGFVAPSGVVCGAAGSGCIVCAAAGPPLNDSAAPNSKIALLLIVVLRADTGEARRQPNAEPLLGLSVAFAQPSLTTVTEITCADAEGFLRVTGDRHGWARRRRFVFAKASTDTRCVRPSLMKRWRRPVVEPRGVEPLTS